MSTPAIHRDRTFDYQGERFEVLGDGPGTPNAGHGYHVRRIRDGCLIADGFFQMTEVRAWLREYAVNDWPLPSSGSETR